MAGPDDAECFDWDDDLLEGGNTAHLAESRPNRPSISQSEAEEVFANGGTFVTNRRDRSGDWLLIGQTHGGRMLTLVVNYEPTRRAI